MFSPETLPETALQTKKAKFMLRSGHILLGTFDDAAEVWARFDVLLASGVDVPVEVIPAVL